MATNYKNTVYDYFSNEKDTFPRSTTLTGTFAVTSGQNVAVGTGTLALSELKVDDWLYIPAKNELRRVTNVFADTTFSFDYPFTGAVGAGTALKVVKAKDCISYKEISLSIPVGSADGVLDGKTLPAGVGISFSKSSRGGESSGKTDITDPVILDTTGTAACVIGVKG